MRMRTVLIGAFALVFGASAAIGVWLLRTTPSEVAKPQTELLVVAAMDINRGETLVAEQLTQLEWPKEMVPEGAITNMKEILDRTVAIPLIKGDLLLVGKLAETGSGRGLAAIIPAGMRAVTIQTPNVATGVAGFILPGNKVDILLTVNSQGTDDLTGGGSTITLLQNLEILAVDQQTDVPQGNKMDPKELRSVTLLATPAEAARLDLGQNKGTLRLTLRNPTDKATEFVDAVTLKGLNHDPSDSATEPAEIAPPATVPEITLPVPRVRKVAPQIRTLRGTQSGQTGLPTFDDEPTDAPPSPEIPLASTAP